MEQLSGNALIIGAGRVGERFAKALHEQNYPTILYDIDPQKAPNLSERLGVLYAYNLTEAIKKAQTVYICTPISNHFESASKAVEAGKAVFCEKPLTGKLHEARELQNLVHSKGSPFIVGNYYRLNSSIFALKQAVESGEIGEVIAIEANYLHDMSSLNEETPWRKGEGFLYEGGVHAVDLACWIAGDTVEQVTAMGDGLKIDSHYHPVDFSINLKFRSGLLAHVRANARAILPEHGAKMTVWGTQGTIEAFNKDEFLRIYKAGSSGFKRQRTPQGELPIDRTVEIVQKFASGELDSFYPLPDIDEAVESIRILDLVEKKINQSNS